MNASAASAASSLLRCCSESLPSESLPSDANATWLGRGLSNLTAMFGGGNLTGNRGGGVAANDEEQYPVTFGVAG